MKKWIQTEKAIFFRMNNQTLQVAFKDDSVLLINTHTKILNFVHKKTSNTFPLEAVSNIENKELRRRLKYTEEVLKNIWTAQSDGAHSNPNKDSTQMGNKHNLCRLLNRFSP